MYKLAPDSLARWLRTVETSPLDLHTNRFRKCSTATLDQRVYGYILGMVLIVSEILVLEKVLGL